ncbi:hypothetical protein [Rhizorhabdus dicambivorans]|uniref:DUF3575 domain-containing protein n=1 Tax=Rhizorhabdus dicambivorans TaxID=1850238 RepID=A0A2A4FT65_9SPHN|nr:hypothetical protein [Rhizorhabdus dicambivorans]ATE65592.1 hypothetical protein CMV14_15250 [Rhizorhabdus dicambivorans]PCE41935.1 hypothetical protein COO09_13005 [Rhizorhabdus dicambivorans]
MAFGRVSLAIIGLLATGSAQAAPRLALNLRGLESGSEVVFHPYRWLTIRRSIAPLRAEPVDDIVRADPLSGRRPRAYALTGDVHPFGDAFRISLGLREDDNRRLLRGSNDRSDIGTARYAPMLTAGLSGTVGEGLVIGADIGVVGRGMTRRSASLVVTPLDLMSGGRGEAKGYRPVVQVSAGYRF